MQAALDNRVSQLLAKETAKLDKFATGADQYYTVAKHPSAAISSVLDRYAYNILGDGTYPSDPSLLGSHVLSDSADEHEAFLVWKWGDATAGVIVAAETIQFDSNNDEITQHSAFAQVRNANSMAAVSAANRPDPCAQTDAMNALICSIQGDDMDATMGHFAADAEMVLFDATQADPSIEVRSRNDDSHHIKDRIRHFLTNNKGPADGTDDRLHGTNFAFQSHHFKDNLHFQSVIWKENSEDWYYRFHVEFATDGTKKDAKIKRLQVLKLGAVSRTVIV